MQVAGTVIGAVTNYFTLVQVLDAKRPYLDGTLVDPTGALPTPVLLVQVDAR